MSGPEADRDRPEGSSRRPDAKRWAAGALFAAFLLGCSSTPSKAECDRIVEHLVDVFTAGKLADTEGKAPSKEYVQAVNKWRQALKDDKDATHESLIQICTSQINASATDCILRAANELELARCFSN